MSLYTNEIAPRESTANIDVESITLPDGAHGYCIENHKLPLVDILISLRSGSSFDPASKIGLVRMFARMLRRGAGDWTSEYIEEFTDRIGAEFSIDASPSSVILHGQVVRRNLSTFVDLITMLFAKPSFDEHELTQLQRETVAEIIESRDQDRALAQRFFRRAVFEQHPYGRGVTGSMQTVPTITRDELLTFHNQHLRRANLVMGIAGDVSKQEVTSIMNQIANAIPGGNVKEESITEPVLQPGRRLIFVDKPARTQTQILIGGLGTHAFDTDHTALLVANTAFGGTFTARLMREVRSKRGWSYGAYSRLGLDRKREAFSLWTFPSATDAAACIALELEMLTDLVEKGISAQELTFAKNYLIESHAFDVDTPQKRLAHTLEEDLFCLPKGYHSQYLDRIRAVTLSDANESLQRRISLRDLVITLVGTADDIQNEVSKAIPSLDEVRTVPFDSE